MRQTPRTSRRQNEATKSLTDQRQYAPTIKGHVADDEQNDVIVEVVHRGGARHGPEVGRRRWQAGAAALFLAIFGQHGCRPDEGDLLWCCWREGGGCDAQGL